VFELLNLYTRAMINIFDLDEKVLNAKLNPEPLGDEEKLA
jgi:hypothetical protein